MVVNDIRNTTLRRIALVVLIAPATLGTFVLEAGKLAREVVRDCADVFLDVWEKR